MKLWDRDRSIWKAGSLGCCATSRSSTVRACSDPPESLCRLPLLVSQAAQAVVREIKSRLVGKRVRKPPIELLEELSGLFATLERWLELAGRLIETSAFTLLEGKPVNLVNPIGVLASDRLVKVDAPGEGLRRLVERCRVRRQHASQAHLG